MPKSGTEGFFTSDIPWTMSIYCSDGAMLCEIMLLKTGVPVVNNYACPSSRSDSSWLSWSTRSLKPPSFEGLRSSSSNSSKTCTF